MREVLLYVNYSQFPWKVWCCKACTLCHMTVLLWYLITGWEHKYTLHILWLSCRNFQLVAQFQNPDFLQVFEWFVKAARLLSLSTWNQLEKLIIRNMLTLLCTKLRCRLGVHLQVLLHCMFNLCALKLNELFSNNPLLCLSLPFSSVFILLCCFCGLLFNYTNLI